LYHVTAHTQRGVTRDQNEDACSIGRVVIFGDKPDVISLNLDDGDLPILITIADGIGGHRGGEIASRTTVEALSQLTKNSIDKSRITNAILDVHRKLQDLEIEGQTYNAMGTTIVGALLDLDRALFFNVGDSRAYRIQNNQIDQISTDDVRAGGNSSVITQCLGGGISTFPKPHLKVLDVSLDDIFIFVSDGISDVVPSNTIMEIASSGVSNPSFDLSQEAIRCGGEDDLSAVIYRSE
jgi:PPM family protein phosphatase